MTRRKITGLSACSLRARGCNGQAGRHTSGRSSIALAMNQGLVQALRLYADRFPEAALVSLEVTIGALILSLIMGMTLAFLSRSPSVSLSLAASGIITASRCLPLPP